MAWCAWRVVCVRVCAGGHARACVCVIVGANGGLEDMVGPNVGSVHYD